MRLNKLKIKMRKEDEEEKKKGKFRAQGKSRATPSYGGSAGKTAAALNTQPPAVGGGQP
jgi:hypothetical protein